MDELRDSFADQVSIEHRFVPALASTASKIGKGWKQRGGWAGYPRHVQQEARRFDYVEVHPEVWTRDVPAGSLASHVFVKAASLLAAEGTIASDRVAELGWGLRHAFFAEARDIGRLDVQLERHCQVNRQPGTVRR